MQIPFELKIRYSIALLYTERVAKSGSFGKNFMPPLQGWIILLSYPGLTAWAIIFCHFVAQIKQFSPL